VHIYPRHDGFIGGSVHLPSSFVPLLKRIAVILVS